MKTLFLDIDGVLNHEISGDDKILDELLDRLKIIIDKTGAQIVLTSTWRVLEENRVKLRAAFEPKGLDWVDQTPDLQVGFPGWDNYIHRSVEIKDWLSRHPEVTRFAILDDEPCAGTNGLECSFYQTEKHLGLTEDIMNDVILNLNASEGYHGHNC